MRFPSVAFVDRSALASQCACRRVLKLGCADTTKTAGDPLRGNLRLRLPSIAAELVGVDLDTDALGKHHHRARFDWMSAHHVERMNGLRGGIGPFDVIAGELSTLSLRLVEFGAGVVTRVDPEDLARHLIHVSTDLSDIGDMSTGVAAGADRLDWHDSAGNLVPEIGGPL
jgi:hypothetical protein